jgi:predicted metal-dependent enzyme (double-stranded beta helix superfamily)
MTLTPALTLDSFGIDPFSPAQLLRTAGLFAADPALAALLDPREQEPRRIQLDSSPHLQVWLLAWPAGTHQGWHDHGDSAGALQVVTGTLLEQTSHALGRQDRIIVAGQGRSFGQNHIHHVANVGVHTALSVHVYAPRLTGMTRYAVTPAGLQPGAVEDVAWRW